MARTKKDKIKMVEDYAKKITAAKSLIILKAKGLTPNESSQLKKELSDANAEFNVVKNSLFKIALKDAKYPEVDSISQGEHVVAFIKEDIITPSKVLKKYSSELKNAEKNPKMVVELGYLEKEFLSKDQAAELAEMPDKAGSVAMILGVLDNALSSIINVLEDAPRAYVNIIDQAFKE